MAVDLVSEAQHKAMNNIRLREDMVFWHLWKQDVIHRIKSGTCTKDDVYSAYAFILKYGWQIGD